MSLSTSSVVKMFETEDNGYGQPADVLTDGQEIRGQLSTSSDVDAFVIDMQRAQER